MMWFIDKRVYNPVTSFVLLYFIIVFLNCIHAFGLYGGDADSYSLILIGVLMFSAGALLSNKYYLKNSKHEADLTFNIKAFYIFLLICLIVILPRFFTISRYLLAGNSTATVYATLASNSEELKMGNLSGVLLQFVGFPLLAILVPTAITQFFYTYKKIFLVWGLILTIIRVLLDSRRTYLVTFFLYIFVAFAYHYKEINWAGIYSRINKRRLRIIGTALAAAAVIFFVFLSRQRATSRGESYSTIKTFSYYFGGSVRYLGECIKAFDASIKSHTYGFTTFRGFFAPIFGIFAVLGFEAPKAYVQATEIVNAMHFNVLSIANGQNYNSFTTCFYQFYVDGGIIGIVILSFLFGVFAQSLYKRFVIFKSQRYEALYMFFFGTILILSFTNMRTILAYVAWPFIIERFLYKNGAEG